MALTALQDAIETTNTQSKSSFEGRLMNTDPKTKAFLLQHAEMQPVARAMAKALEDAFCKSDLRVRVVQDPDSGAQKLRFEIVMAERGAEARAKLREFVRTKFPAIAKPVSERLVITLAQA